MAYSTIEVVRCWFDMICEEGFFRLTQVSAVTNDQEVVPTSKPEATLHLLYSTMV